MNLNKKFSTLPGIIIIIASIVIIIYLLNFIFSFLGIGYPGALEIAKKARNEKLEAKLISFEIVPSCEAKSGGIIYPAGAKAIAKGKNLSKVEFWVIPPGSSMIDSLYNETPIIKNGDRWETVLSPYMWEIDLYAVGYDLNGNIAGKIYIIDDKPILPHGIFGPDSSGGAPNADQYPESCKTD